MKKISAIIWLLIAGSIGCIKMTTDKGANASYPTMEQLDTQYKASWDKPEYAAANSAANETYLTDNEKKVYYYLNLARMNPQLFAATYASGYKGANGYANAADFDKNEASLITELNSLSRLSVLAPGKDLYPYARCQAQAIGIAGTTGMDAHNRSVTGCTIPMAYGENIDFGSLNALDIVMSWLNDAGNVLGANQLGHRENCLNPSYNVMSISIQPHKVWGECVVMDLTY